MDSIWSSCFEVKVSPKQKRPLDEDNSCFILAPFQKGPVINFEKVKVGSKKAKALPVINGTRSSIRVKLTKCPPQFTFNLLEFTVPASGRTELEISWTPVESGSWRHVVKVQTDTVLKFDLVLICSSKDTKVLPKKRIKHLKPIVGKAQNLIDKNRCAYGINLGFGSSIENTKLIATGFDNSNTQELLKNGPEVFASVRNGSSRRATMVLSKNKLICNKENVSFEREKCVQNIATSKISIDEICEKSLSKFKNESSFTSICDDKLEFCLEPNDNKIKNRKNWSLLDNRSGGILYQQKHVGEEYNSKKLEAKNKILQLNEKFAKGDQSLSSDSDKFSDSLEDSKTFPKADDINVSISSPLVKELGKSVLSDIDENFDFLGVGVFPACMKSKKMTNTDFSFVSEAKTNKLCTPSWLQTPEFSKYRPGTDVENHAGENFLDNFCYADSPLKDKICKPENAFNFSFTFSTPNIIKSSADFTELNYGNNIIMSSNVEEKAGQMLNANISKFEITEIEKLNHWEKFGRTPITHHGSLTGTRKKMPVEIEKLNHWEKVGTMPNLEHEGFTGTPKNIPVLSGGRTETKRIDCDVKPQTHCKFVGLDFCNRPTEVKTSNIKMELECDTFHSGNGIRILQFSPPRRKTLKSSPKLYLGTQTRLKACSKKRSPKFNPKKSVNREAQAHKNSSAENSFSSASISKLRLNVQKKTPEKSFQLYDPDNLMKPSLHSNPFIQTGIYCDLEWIDLQEKDLMKWLNTLLSPPDDLATNQQYHGVDVVELWQQVRKQKNNVELGTSREQASLTYHTHNWLSTLRKAARALFQTDYLANIFCRLSTHIDKQLITLREDRNFFIDIGLQHKLLELFLCYNPLWLRIGLETIYGKTVPVQSNSDTVGLISFIMHNFLENSYLKERYPNPNEYMRNITKLALKKFLILVYFLDQAKTNKLIQLNPCLFTKNARCKASRDILLSFSREFLSGVGDITKHLKTLGYVVCHEQIYIDEFDFSVRNHLDLRDGIRLCKVMEIILHDETILYKLRAPAISKLQKMHNVSIALSALESAGYEITGGITPNDIVNGHREKTLSLLWQIIYNFQQPKFVAAAIKLQKWWRSLMWKERFNNSIVFKRQLRAAVTIQRRARANNKMRKERSTYLHFKGAVIKIQRWYRASFLMKTYRRHYIFTRAAVLKIQNWYRATILMHRQITLYNRYKNSAVLIQNWFRHINQKRLLMKKQRENLAATSIQRKFLSWKQRKYFISLKSVVILLQRKFRENRKKKFLAEEMKRKILASVCIQQWYRKRKSEYLENVRRNSAATLIQRNFRAYREMQVERKNFISLHTAAVVIQRRFKANRLLKLTRESEMFIMQQKVTAATKIQAYWRGYSVRKAQSKKLKKCLSRNVERPRKTDKVCETIRTIYSINLDSLLMKANLKQAKKEISILSNLTEVSRELCSDLAASGHLLKIFLGLKNCNRSLPFQNVCLSGTKILVNVVRDPRNHCYVLQVEDSLSVILLLMSKYVTVDNDIFCNCCKILWLLAQEKATAQVIRNVRDCQSRLLLFYQQKVKKLQTIRAVCKNKATSSKHAPWMEPTKAIEMLLCKLEIPLPTVLI